jgi:hypothetical protein
MAFTPAGPTSFNLNIDGGQVWAMEGDPATGSVYVGGDFKTVNGRTASLVKVNAAGQVDAAFNPPFRAGRVNEIELVNVGGTKRLIVGGSFGGKLLALNPATGSNTGLIKESITGEVCYSVCSWGTTSVYDFAVSGDRLAAVGNFAQVGGLARLKFAMLDLSRAAGDQLTSWYHSGFAKRCATDHERRVANLQGVDFSPSGSHFSVAATGQIPASHADIWHFDGAKPVNSTVCDAVGRFAVADMSKPQWINYTGGDSVWTVADTGAAVYAQGHFKWMDNPDGHASLGTGDSHSGRPAARRPGIAAINPATGLALPWNPGVSARSGGRALEVTPDGLWVGSDSPRFGSEQHYGIAFAPLP